MKIIFLLNPASGAGTADLRDTIERTAAAAERDGVSWRVEETRPGETAGQARAAFAGADVVIAVGGDGTVHAVVSGYMEDPRPGKAMGVYPAGTGNDFFRHFHRWRDFRRDPEGYLRRLLERPRRVRHVVWKAGNLFFANYVSLGYDAAVSAEVEKRRAGKRAGRFSRAGNFLLYAVTGIRRALHRPEGEMVMRTDAGEVRSRMGLIVAGIRSYAAGSVMPWKPGMLSAVGFHTWRGYLRILSTRLTGRPAGKGEAVFFTEGEIRAAGPGLLQVDGESRTMEALGHGRITRAGEIEVVVGGC